MLANHHYIRIAMLIAIVWCQNFIPFVLNLTDNKCRSIRHVLPAVPIDMNQQKRFES
jgi:hypothetical protein